MRQPGIRIGGFDSQNPLIGLAGCSNGFGVTDMTFFGHEGTKTGIPKFAFVIFTLAINLISLNANAFTSSGGSEAAATEDSSLTTMAQIMTSQQPGSTTPATASDAVPGARTAFYSGQMVLRHVKSNFRVRPDLTLENTRWYTATIVPRFENGNTSALREGWYLLRVVVTLPTEEFSDMSDEDRFVSRFDILGYFSRQTGNFMVTFPLIFNDMTRGWIRDNIYVKIEALDQTSINVVNGRVDAFATSKVVTIDNQLMPLVPPGRFIPFSPTNEPVPVIPRVSDFDPIGDDLDNYIKRVELKKVDLDQAPVIDEDTYVDSKWAKLQMVNLNSRELDDNLHWNFLQLTQVPQHLNRAAIQDLLEIKPTYVQEMPNKFDLTAARAICVQIAKQQGMRITQVQAWVEKCSYAPYYYLNIHKNIHVRTQDTWHSKAKTGHDFTAQIITNLSLNSGESTDTYFSMSMNTSVMPLSAFAETLNLTPLQAGLSVGHGHTKSKVVSGISQTFKSFRVFQYLATIPLERYRACVAFEINPDHWGAKMMKRGIYICDSEKIQPLLFTESYYVGTEDTLGDYDFAPQAVNVLLRGDREITNFLRIADNEITPAQSNSIRVGQAFAYSAYHYSQIPGAIPGVITLPMAPMSDIESDTNPKPPQTGGFISALKSWF
jgi:hypothetical protein